MAKLVLRDFDLPFESQNYKFLYIRNGKSKRKNAQNDFYTFWVFANE